MTINVTVGQFQKKTDVAENDNGEAPQSGKLGLAVSDLTSEVKQQINAPDQLHGAVVQNVRPASPAEDAGLQPGDGNSGGESSYHNVRQPVRGPDSPEHLREGSAPTRLV